MEEQAAFGSTACQNCHSTMPLSLRFCRNCGFRLGEGVAEYTETVRFSNAQGGPAANGFGAGPAYMAPAATTAISRRKKRMSGMTWIFLAMIVFFLTAGVVTQLVRPIRALPGITAPPAPPRSYFGINEFDTTDGGVTFDSIEAPGSPADKAGLVGGDIITMFDGQKVTTDDEMMEVLGKTPIGKTVDLAYIRDGEASTTKLTTISKSELDELNRAFAKRPEGIGRMGIDVGDEVEIENSKLRGVRIGSVERSMPADMAGFKEGDIVIKFAGVPIRTEEELSHRIRRAIPYEIAEVVVMRGSEQLTIPVKMGRR